MERWVRIIHILLLLVNIAAFSYAVYDIVVDLWVMELPAASYSSQWLFLAGGVGLAGYLEALSYGTSRWIKWSYACYVIAVI